MKKAKYLPLLLLIFVSCEKAETKTKCYSCEVGIGPTWEIREICTNQIDTVQFEDSQGNQLQSTCTEK